MNLHSPAVLGMLACLSACAGVRPNSVAAGPIAMPPIVAFQDSTGPLEYRAPSEDELVGIRDESDEDAIASLSVSLAADLLAESNRNGWPMPNRDLSAYVAEVRDALLVDGRLSRLQQLVDVLSSAGASELRDQMLRGLGDARTLEAVLAQVPLEADKLPPDLAAVPAVKPGSR